MPAPNVAPPLSVVGVDPWEQNRDALNALQQVVRNLPHNALPVLHNCPVGGVLDLTNASVALQRVANIDNPEDPYDDVRRINPLTLADGLTVSFETAAPGTPVTLRHMSFSGAQVGELDLAGDVDVILISKSHRIVMQRRGNRVVEVSRSGYATEGEGGGVLTQFNNDIDAGGNAVTNLMRKTRDSASTTTTITTADRDIEVHISGSNVTLPTNPAGWRRGDTVILVQRGPDLLLSPAVNIVSPLNHDRGYGIGATVIVVVHDLSNPMKWRLGGLTKSGTVIVPPTEISRIAVWASSAGQTDTPAGSAAYVTALTLSHTCGAGTEKWAYITGGKLSLSPSNNANQGHARMRKSAPTPDAAGPSTMSGRYFQAHEATGFLNTRTYSTADTHAFVLELFADIDPDTTATSTLFMPFMLGIKLETDEHFAGTGTAVAANSTTYVDGLSYSATFVAGDYLVIGWCEWTTSNAIGANVRLQVDGGNWSDRTRDKPNIALMPGNFSALKKVTLTAGTKVSKIQIALPTGASGTATSQRAQIDSPQDGQV